MKKLKGFTILIMILCVFFLTSCSKQEGEVKQETTSTVKANINIAALKGPTAIGMVKIMNDNENSEAANHYNFSLYGAADEITAKLIKGELDIAAVPSNLASVLYNKTKGQIKVAAVNTLGVLYIVETGDTIQSVEDLKGKTIYSTGKGATPEYTLNYLLNSSGIDPEKDVTIEYKSEPTEIAALLNSTDNAIAMLPQPYVTTVMMNNDKVRIALDVNEEWNKISTDNSTVVTGVVVARKEFIDANKDAFESFLKEYNDSTTYVNENVEDAAKLVEKFDIFKASVAKKAIPDCNITFLTGPEMQTNLTNYLATLYEQNPKSIGGAMPEDDFYYMGE